MGLLHANRRDLLRAIPAATTGFAMLAGAGAALAQSSSDQGQAGDVSLPDPSRREGELAEINGAKIFYQTAGDGEPMMLLHGYPLSGALFARVRDDLTRRHRVITIDHRGYGRSDAPAVPDSIDVYAGDALGLMQKLGVEKAAIGGMSMGGPIVFEMYRQAPDRFAAMMLIDTIAAPANPAEAGLWRGVAEMVKQNGVEAILPVLIKEMLTGDTRVNQPELVTYLESVMKNASKDAAIGGALALAKRPDATDLLGQIKVPTLVYVGLEDSVYPIEIAHTMHAKIANSTLEIIPDAAHAAIFEKPQASAEAILKWSGDVATRTGSVE